MPELGVPGSKAKQLFRGNDSRQINGEDKIDKIFTVDLTVTTYYQIDGEDFVNFCGLFRKREL